MEYAKIDGLWEHGPVYVSLPKDIDDEKLAKWASYIDPEEIEWWYTRARSRWGAPAIPGPGSMSDLEKCRLWQEMEHQFTPSIYPVTVDGKDYLALIAVKTDIHAVDCKTFTTEGARAYVFPPREWIAARGRETLNRLDRTTAHGKRDYDYYFCDVMPGFWVDLDE